MLQNYEALSAELQTAPRAYEQRMDEACAADEVHSDLSHPLLCTRQLCTRTISEPADPAELFTGRHGAAV